MIIKEDTRYIIEFMSSDGTWHPIFDPHSTQGRTHVGFRTEGEARFELSISPDNRRIVKTTCTREVLDS
jgi:hypothetical protein